MLTFAWQTTLGEKRNLLELFSCSTHVVRQVDVLPGQVVGKAARDPVAIDRQLNRSRATHQARLRLWELNWLG
jgi:hypothetical protein